MKAKDVSHDRRRADSKPDPAALPRGPHKLSREFVVRSQRDRLLDAMAEACATRGYTRVTVATVTKRAGVSRKTFYDLFSDREDCFLQAYDAILAKFLGRVIGAYERPAHDWAERLRAAIKALLAFLAAEPAFARMCLVEVLSAGERAMERYLSAVRLLAGLLDEGRAMNPPPSELPDGTALAVIHGCALVLREQIMAGRTAELTELLPDLLYAALVAYVGQEQALAHAYGD